jgi:adenosylcobinamide-GDP ribazoletransferase
LFYTCLPLPRWWKPSFAGIAALAPVVGFLLGIGLEVADSGLSALGASVLLRSALVVGLWLGLTGGLHLDGAMDTADGLAVMDPQQRLAVMADSRTGAFGTMTAIAILGLKTLALADLGMGRGWILVTVPLWSRWGQVVAIARYPYLKTAGKGALHKAHLRLPQDLLPGFGLGILLCIFWVWKHPTQGSLAIGSLVISLMSALLVGAWLHRRLGGHTGDTYGATVEWAETLTLCLVAAMPELLP